MNEAKVKKDGTRIVIVATPQSDFFCKVLSNRKQFKQEENDHERTDMETKRLFAGI